MTVIHPVTIFSTFNHMKTPPNLLFEYVFQMNLQGMGYVCQRCQRNIVVVRAPFNTGNGTDASMYPLR